MAIQRGEIYFVDLNPTKGREQAGRRPVVVMSADMINHLPLVVTVVIGTKGANISKDYSTNVRVPATESGLPDETVFMAFQIRSLDPSRFTGQPAGRLSPGMLSKLEGAVRICLDLQ